MFTCRDPDTYVRASDGHSSLLIMCCRASLSTALTVCVLPQCPSGDVNVPHCSQGILFLAYCFFRDPDKTSQSSYNTSARYTGCRYPDTSFGPGVCLETYRNETVGIQTHVSGVCPRCLLCFILSGYRQKGVHKCRDPDTREFRCVGISTRQVARLASS